jgi:PAS domain S-box-containing protein
VIEIVLVVSLVLQLAAVGLALRLIPLTRARAAWLFLAAGFLLMAARRSITTWRVFSGDASLPADPAVEWVALAISALIATGLALFGSHFRSAKESEARATENEARLREIADTVSDAFWVMSPDFARFLYVSPSFTRLWKLRPGEDWTRPEKYYARIHQDDMRHMDELRAQVGAGHSFETEFRVTQPDGKVLHFRTRAFPVKGPGGTERAIGITQDITELVALRTQLLHSQKLDALGRLAGGVAHDFNNLLTVILGYSESAIEEMPEAGRLRASLEEIRAAGHRAADLTRRLLAFSRRQPAQPSVLDLNEVVSAAQGMLRRLLGETIRLETKLAPSLRFVLADPGQIDQVLMNLAVNARDAMPRGGTLTIETANAELTETEVAPRGGKPGAYAVLTVRDTGLGMDAAVLDRLFEPFFTTKPPGHGTGLGLSTVYGIVNQAGGFITVESRPGAGSSFRLHFPKAEGTPTPQVAGGRPKPIAAKLTVLIVEDEDAIRRMIRQSLEQCGHRVLDAGDGQEALRVSRRHPDRIDLLLTDSVMPQMNGETLAIELRRERPELKVLLMSGYTEDASNPGSLPCLAKPFTMEQLASRILEVMP